MMSNNHNSTKKKTQAVFYKVPKKFEMSILFGGKADASEEEQFVCCSMSVEPFVRKMVDNYCLFVRNLDEKARIKMAIPFFVETIVEVGLQHIYFGKHYKYIDVVDVYEEICHSYNKAKNSLGSNASTLKGMELLISILWLNIFNETMEEAAYENLSMWRGTSV